VLIHRHDDASDDDHRWRAFVEQQGFGHLVAAGRGRDVPVIVPTQYLLDGERVLLHLAAPNPLLVALAEQPMAVLSVAGDWAYVPGTWKTVDGEDPSRGIPTTYYGAVQLTGPVTVHRDPERIAAVLRRQVIDQEGADHGLVDPTEHGPRLRTIRALELEVREVRAKFKYGGNVDEAHRRAVADRLLDRAGPGDAAAASHIRLDG
jgi:transcriptional regulator